MKRKSIILGAALLALLALCAGTAQAAPQNGFSLNGGFISSSTDQTYTTGLFTGQTLTYKGGGISLGLDYQFVINENFSINPFLMTSGETVSVNNVTLYNVTSNHGILGVQFRYWIGDVYVGGHIGSYSEQLNYRIGNAGFSTNASGGGAGLVAGWENPNGGFYVQGQLDSSKPKYTNANTKLIGTRLSLGYRWK